MGRPCSRTCGQGCRRSGGPRTPAWPRRGSCGLCPSITTRNRLDCGPGRHSRRQGRQRATHSRHVAALGWHVVRPFARTHGRDREKYGSASCRESVCRYVEITEVRVPLQIKTTILPYLDNDLDDEQELHLS